MNKAVVEGSVLAVASDRAHHLSKPLRDAIILVEGHGIEGDAHAGPFVRDRYLARRRPGLANLRQVHLIPGELFDEMRRFGYDLRPGELGENVTTSGLDLEQLPLGSLLKLGATAAVELTGLRTPCVLIDGFRTGLKEHLTQMVASRPRFRWGVLGIVSVGGQVTPGDFARAELPSGPQHTAAAIALPKKTRAARAL
jgi:MOSC domain-containing protein YiiM